MIDLIVDFASETEKLGLYKVLKSRKPKKYRVEIKEHRNDRSNNQNRYYWGVLIKILCDHTGYNPDEMHEVLKGKFNPKEIVFKKTGESVTIGASTTEMNTVEFMNYIEKIQIWALADLDCLIPNPNEF